MGWLSMPHGDAFAVLARLEFHSDHGEHAGLHLHAPCQDIAEVEAGEPQTRNYVRLPGGYAKHRRGVFETTTDDYALICSYEFFNVTSRPVDSPW
jgi:hypothetical protein